MFSFFLCFPLFRHELFEIEEHRLHQSTTVTTTAALRTCGMMQRAVAIMVATAAATASGATDNMAVICTVADDNTMTCTPTTASGSASEWTASATYSPDTSHASHFGEIRVETNEDAETDALALFGAGFVEGALTAERLYQSSLNVRCQLNCTGAVR